MTDRGPAIALTMGEPAGIGGEIGIKAWLRRAEGVPPFFLIDDAVRLAAIARGLGVELPIEQLEGDGCAATTFAQALPVLHRPLPAPALPGRLDTANGEAVISAIATAVDLVRKGRASAVVTNPIHKGILYQAGFAFPGHTEYLSALAGAGCRTAMMLVCPGLRVVPVTVHLPLGQAIASLTTDAIVAQATIAEAALRQDFAIPSPRLAVAALNPHAGEGGALGTEEETIVAPAVAALRARKIDAFGPVPPDALFTPGTRQGYDVAICMYHDQALIPLKALDFDGGVNVTLGLPFVRTSPDHGTALDIAGTGKAREASLIAALGLAQAMVRRRLGGAGAAGSRP